MASELSSFIDEELKKKRVGGEAETARLVPGALDVEVCVKNAACVGIEHVHVAMRSFV